MKNSQKLSFTFFGIFLFVFLNTLFSCAGLFGPDKKGSLIIRSYSESYAADPSVITADLRIQAILDVAGPNSYAETVVTDDLGYYDFGELVVGEYTIQPRYFPVSAARTVTVRADMETEEAVPIPAVAMSFYVLNGGSVALSETDIRKALCAALDRSAILGIVGEPKQALYNMVPPQMAGPWMVSALSLSESIQTANTLLGEHADIEFGILFNDSPENQTIAESLQSSWQNLSGSGFTAVTVNLTSQAWDAFIQTRDTDKNFDVARHGWVMDSNNLLVFYESLGNYIDDDAYTGWLTSARDKLESGDITGYENDIVAINNYLIDNAFILPLYSY